jgi:outer membrane protein OmpA-like peptidoglycan-associated protein
MMKCCITVFLLVACCLFSPGSFAQSTAGRWSIGVHGGANLWVNDMNHRKVGLGGEAYFRYGVTPFFSLGAQGGYEDLKAFQDPLYIELPQPYLKLRASHASVVGWIHLSPGQRFAPYMYVGAGIMMYKRSTTFVHVPKNQYYTSIHFPVGVGFEAFFGPNASFVLEAGGRLLDDKTENFAFKSPDWYGSVKAGLNFYLGSGGADDDDKDGLTNAQEEQLGTDPNNADTDGDGLKDGEEVRRYRTDPLKVDSDADGLNDGDEVLKYRTDPAQQDTDGDGLGDGDELLKYRTDPLRIDTDGDTLTDGDEVLKYNTDPLKFDTDGDGLTDWDEVRVYKTDPNNPDTDGDSLLDGDEVRKHKTDPTKSDTDGGGVTDSAEVQRGTNPLDPRDDGGTTPQRPAHQMLMEGGSAVTLQGVNFISGSARLLQAAEQTLDRAYKALIADPALRIEIAGYADNVGSATLNERLSWQRAEAVRQWLVQRGIDPARLIAVGKGSSEPMDTNATAEGRANNRRVEFHVLK